MQQERQREGRRTSESVLRFPVICLLLVSLLTGCSRKKVDVNPGPAQILFDVSEVYLGEIEGKGKTEADVTFYNIGSEPLVIHDVRTSCHCTVADYPKKPIGPGDSGTLHVTLDAEGISGHFTRSVTVYSNTKSGTDMIRVTGTVREPSQ